ncbi:hypothetical protein N8482_03075, partial [Chitinophagales bacterium]|nr:hypothetical protein [Chitinophagales bacterium]
MRAGSFVVLLLILIVTSSCADDSGEEMTCTKGYDQTALLENMADNIILPSYLGLKQQMNELNNAIASFINEQTILHLQEAQAQFKTTYLS